MRQEKTQRWVETRQSVILAGTIIFALLAALFWYQAGKNRRDALRRQARARQLQAQADSRSLMAGVTHTTLYFASLGKTTKERVTAKMVGGFGRPEHPRILKIHPSLREMQQALGPPASQENSAAEWKTAGLYGLETKLYASFKNDHLIAATLETGQYREHIGRTAEEWRWQGAP